MAKVEALKLKIDLTDTEAVVDVGYKITFNQKEMDAKEVFEETCRLIGDDTNVGDPPEAGGDDTVGFVTPLFTKDAAADGPTITRTYNKRFRRKDLDEDRGPLAGRDEIRALVTLRPTSGKGRTFHHQSNLVKIEA